MSTSRSSYLAGLPSFFGSKKIHLPWIFSSIAQVIPHKVWPQMIFKDAFLGGGAVSLSAKARGFQTILANDCSERSQIIGRAFLNNQKTTLSHQDMLWLAQSMPSEAKPGLVETHYCPSVFSTRHARQLDNAFYWTHQIQDETKRALCLALIWQAALDFVCFPTSLGTSSRPYAEALDGLRNWDTITPKRFIDGSIARLLQPALKVMESKRVLVNRSVFSGPQVQLFKRDALEFLANTDGDIAYMDSPYAGTLRYETSYAVLDHLLTGKSEPTPPSIFSTDTQALDLMLEAVRETPHWVISYGNKVINLSGLIDLVQRHAGKRKVSGWAKKCIHMPHVSKNTDNQELLIIAHTTQEVISYAR